nr:hypothetical protein CFP56_30819 [Quercus suber]
MDRKTSCPARSSKGLPLTAPSASSTGQHPYLRNQEICAIKHWTASVPSKTRQSSGSNDHDAAIKAYQQAKVELIQRSRSST